jgi:two-component system response regulator NreC
MPEKRKVVIAEDHTLFRELLRETIEMREDLEVVAEACDGLEAISCVMKNQPDLLVLDLSMPKLSGISVVKDVRLRYPELKILVLTIHTSDNFINETFKAGINGYCLKDSSRSDLLNAVDSVLQGKLYLSPAIAKEVIQGYLSGPETPKVQNSWGNITHREREVLKLLAEGHMNKQIAPMLHISVKTVEKHRANIMAKLGLHNVAALTAYAIEQGLVTSNN